MTNSYVVCALLMPYISIIESPPLISVQSTPLSTDLNKPPSLATKIEEELLEEKLFMNIGMNIM